jgi:hypothetical protein
MFEGANGGRVSPSTSTWIVTFDWVGYLLFFNTIFYVWHAVCIILWSIFSSSEYHRFHVIPLIDVCQQIESVKNFPFQKILYGISYYPMNLTRQYAEFKVIHILFRDTFGIPSDFEFDAYLSKCFERYSLNIIKLGGTSWLILLILHGLNLIRIYLIPTPQLRCTEPEVSAETHRYLAADESQTHHAPSPYDCNKGYTRAFLLAGLLLIIYVVVTFIIGRIYTLRLLSKGGVDISSDILDVLTIESHNLVLSLPPPPPP